MPLALDYRPQTLEEFEGNSEIKKSLGSILKRTRKEIPHAFLFTGLSGGGKTTLAGIVANSLKCSSHELYELNSGSFRGIDTVRELEKTIRYKPMHGEVRVWIMNEIHKVTNDAQNAMLDMIEKAPAHVYFMLTTTDPQKLITPLRKRCVEYNVLPLSDDEMLDFLDFIVEEEKANVPQSVKEKITTAANGSSRNALQLLETVINLSPKDMEKAAIRLEDEETLAKDLFDALIAKKDWKVVAGIIKRLTSEPEATRYSIMGLANSMLLNGYGNPKRAALVLECFSKNTYDSGKNAITLFAYEAVL